MSKIRPLIEYASGVWIGSVTKTTLEEIDSIQYQFLRGGMGVPPFASKEGVLAEMGLVKQSLRLQAERIKLYLRISKKFCPEIVSKMWNIFNNVVSTKKVVKSFAGTSKPNVCHARKTWVQANRNRIFLPPGQNFSDFLVSLSDPMDSKYGFKWVYPSGRASMPWKANIYVRGDRKHEGVHCDSRILQEVNVLIQQEASNRTKFVTVLSKSDTWGIILTAVKKWVLQQQISRFASAKGCRKLSRLRENKWYGDSLLHSIRDPLMRQVRKLRLGVSDLLGHTHFLNDSSQICTRCSLGEIESCDHFFLRCSAYSVQRVDYFRQLKTLGVTDFGSARPMLGINKKLVSKAYRKKTINTRRRILRKTFDFIQVSKRFTH